MSSFCRKLIFCSEVSVGFWLLASSQKVFAPSAVSCFRESHCCRLVEEFGLKKSGLLYRSWNRVFLICFVEGLCSQRGCMQFLEGR